MEKGMLLELAQLLTRIAMQDDSYDQEFKDLRLQVTQLEKSLTGRNVNELNNRLTYDQISAEYKISLVSLKKWKKAGLIIPICKGGRNLIFDREEVEQCLLNRPRIKPSFLKKSA